MFVRSGFLKPCFVSLGVQFQCPLRVFQGFRVIAGSIVIGAEIYMCAREIAVRLLVQSNCLPIAGKSSRVVPKSFLGEP